MMDYSSGEITTAEAAQLIQAVNEAFRTDELLFYPGISYRHCMIWHNGPTGLYLTPPHDISDRKITEYLPKNPVILDLMSRSYEVLKDHPVNQARKTRGLNPANSIWLWGEGKGEAALKTLLDGQDLVYIHVEAPDECGHHGDLKGKIRSIELIDQEIVGPLLEGLEKAGEDYSILVMPDHPTPIAIKTHVADPIPYVLYRSTQETDSGIDTYTEETAKATGNYEEHGYELMRQLLNPGKA